MSRQGPSQEAYEKGREHPEEGKICRVCSRFNQPGSFPSYWKYSTSIDPSQYILWLDNILYGLWISLLRWWLCDAKPYLVWLL